MTRRARSGPPAGAERVSVLDYMAAMRAADEKFQAERDRRYAEVSVEREKALKIKEVADLAALQLAREIQTYKDEKANELREQISSERGNYATREDLSAALREVTAMIKPLAEYVSSQQGRSTGLNAGWGYLLGAASLIGLIITLIVR